MSARRPPKPRGEFGHLLQGRLDDLGMKQMELAIACGIYKHSISNYVTGKGTPKKETVAKMEKVLGFGVGELESCINREKEDPSRYIPSKRERAILAAWNCGELTKEQVAKKTGYSVEIVDRFIPE